MHAIPIGTETNMRVCVYMEIIAAAFLGASYRGSFDTVRALGAKSFPMYAAASDM